MSDYGYAEHQRGTKWWGKSVLLTFDWAGIPAPPKVRRREGATIISRYRNNGYVRKNHRHNKKPHTSYKMRGFFS